MADALKPTAWEEMPTAAFSPFFPPHAGWKLLWEQLWAEKGCLAQGISGCSQSASCKDLTC